MNNIDEIRKFAIIALVSDDYLLDRLVLKGGNAINYIYNISGRSSIDIDYSISDEFTEKEFKIISKKLEDALKKTFLQNGYRVFDFEFVPVPKKISNELKMFWGGYKINFKIIDRETFETYENDKDALRRRALVMGPEKRKTFKIDVSKFEYCGNKIRKSLDDYNIYVYSPEMMIFEKVRAICQQTEEYKKIVKTMTRTPRARDFYDIHLLINKFPIKIKNQENIEIMKMIFKSKKVPLDILKEVHKYRDFHALDYPSVEATVNVNEDLKDFNFYFDFFLENFCS